MTGELNLGGEGWSGNATIEDSAMNNVIYIVGLIVVVLVILSFFGLR
jgi:hypothetical protein